MDIGDMVGNRIDPFEYKIFSLFNCELGYEVLMEMRDRAFFEEPGADDFSGERFAWCDGRKSVLREIMATVEKVRSIIKEANHVGEQPG
ncbi:MAG TPA: hypothetical protein VLK33_08215 [Terriglobales bacterium]|nr:hypothetical protein [Terriglobales bacterium]